MSSRSFNELLRPNYRIERLGELIEALQRLQTKASGRRSGARSETATSGGDQPPSG